MLRKLWVVLLLAGIAYAGTITGSLQTPTSGTVNNGTLTFDLSQSTIVSGTASIVPSTSACYTSNSGAVVGIPDPIILPSLSVNTGSGTLAAGTYYVKITYTGSGVESFPSPESVINLVSTGTVIVSAPALQPASSTGYKVYISSASGTETLQGTVTGWANYSQSSALISGTALPSSNTSACTIYFSDQMIPTGTYYSVNLKNKNGTQMSGYPQTWCTYGGAGGTINVSSGAPTGNCGTAGVYYPTPIVTTPGLNAQQSISGPLSLGQYKLTVGSLENIWFADQYPSITSALAAAGSAGWVLIPKNYAGADTYTSGTYKNVIDLRGNFFGVYQYIAPSRPITGYPLGNDLALDVDGPADLYLANGDLGSAITTTATAITATIPTTITVGDSTKFSIAAAYARIDPGKGDGVDDTCTLNSIADSTHMNVTCVYNHSGTVDVWQKGNLVVKGWSGFSYQPTQPANYSTCKFPFFVGTSFAYTMRWGVNPSDPWPCYSLGLNLPITGISAGGANHYPVNGDLVVRNSDNVHAFRMQDSTGATVAYVPDSHFGIATYLQDDSGVNPASTGFFRLRNSAKIFWRNTANSGDLELAVDSSDRLVFNGAGIVSLNGSLSACNGAGNLCASFRNTGLTASRDYTLPDVAGPIPVATANSVNHAVCWKTATTIGYCSDVVSASGTCTCN